MATENSATALLLKGDFMCKLLTCFSRWDSNLAVLGAMPCGDEDCLLGETLKKIDV
jgi:hypothetical protein